MYNITTIDFDYWCEITFYNKKGKEFKIQCSNDFGEKFYKKFVLLPNKKYPKESYAVKTYFVDGHNTMYFKKKFSLIRLYWLKFRGFLSLLIEEMFI